MIDFVKMELLEVNLESILTHPHLHFKKDQYIDEFLVYEDLIHSDQILTAKYNQLTFEVKPSTNRIFLKGSLHKHWNSKNNVIAPNQFNSPQIEKGFNGNTFNYQSLKTVIGDLETTFSFDAKNAILSNLEFGLNLFTDVDIETFLEGLFSYQNKEFSKPLSNSYRQAVLTHLTLKYYNKTLQYGLSENVLRIEDKYRRMQSLNRLGISHLSDLLKKELLKKLASKLLSHFEGVLFFDYTTDYTRLQASDMNFYLQSSNPNFWKSLAPNRRDYYKKCMRRKFREFSKSVHNHICFDIIFTAEKLTKS